MDEWMLKINNAINLGVEYLYQHQFPNGEFCAYIANDSPMLKWTATDTSVFTTAIISGSLLFLQDHPKADEVLKKATFFFECQMGEGGVWNHFTHRHELRPILPFDVDDTSCVSAVFKCRGIDWPSPSNLHILLRNRNKEGLFYTWIVYRGRISKSKTYWKLVMPELLQPIKSYTFWHSGEFSRNDVDAVVNANVLFYLGENKHTQPIIDYLLKIIEENREGNCDTWYRNPFAVYYFFTRNYYNGIKSLEPMKKPIIERVLMSVTPDGCIGSNVQDTSLAICTLINLGYDGQELENAIKYLLMNQKETGEWERRVLYWGGPKLLLGWGSEELSTGFCLEALERYRCIKTGMRARLR